MARLTVASPHSHLATQEREIRQPGAGQQVFRLRRGGQCTSALLLSVHTAARYRHWGTDPLLPEILGGRAVAVVQFLKRVSRIDPPLGPLGRRALPRMDPGPMQNKTAARVVTGCPRSIPSIAVMAEPGLTQVAERHVAMTAQLLFGMAEAEIPSRRSTVTGCRTVTVGEE